MSGSCRPVVGLRVALIAHASATRPRTPFFQQVLGQLAGHHIHRFAPQQAQHDLGLASRAPACRDRGRRLRACRRSGAARLLAHLDPPHFAVFSQQTPQAVDLRGAKLHQVLPHPMQRQNSLLRFALDRHRLDPGLLNRRPDRPRVVRIVLVAADERPHHLRRQQADLVAKRPEPAEHEIVGSAAP